MKLLSWNVRGLRNPRAKDCIRQLVTAEHPHIFFVVETKVSKEDFNNIARSFGYSNSIAFSARGSAGGVGLCWTNDVQITLLYLSSSHIDVVVNDDGDGKSWWLTGFYGRPERRRRHESWSLLLQLITHSTLPWLCIGDFNEILWTYEKKGGRRHTEASSTAFMSVVDDCHFIDLGYKGNWYTWERGLSRSNNIQQRLDRGFGTQSWWELMADFTLRNLVNSHSDHSPLLLSTGVSNTVRDDIAPCPLASKYSGLMTRNVQILFSRSGLSLLVS